MRTISCFVVLFLISAFLLLPGCAQRPAEVKAADLTKRKALLQYKANTDEIHRAEQRAYSNVSNQFVEKLFELDLAEIQKRAGADGKVDVKFTSELFARAMANRDKNRAAVEAEVEKIKAVVDTADKDFMTALKLDEMLGQFYDAGIDPADAQKFVEQILSVVKRE